MDAASVFIHAALYCLRHLVCISESVFHGRKVITGNRSTARLIQPVVPSIMNVVKECFDPKNAL